VVVTMNEMNDKLNDHKCMLLLILVSFISVSKAKLSDVFSCHWHLVVKMYYG
jgi:hypothetical protein